LREEYLIYRRKEEALKERWSNLEREMRDM